MGAKIRVAFRCVFPSCADHFSIVVMETRDRPANNGAALFQSLDLACVLVRSVAIHDHRQRPVLCRGRSRSSLLGTKKRAARVDHIWSAADCASFSFWLA